MTHAPSKTRTTLAAAAFGYLLAAGALACTSTAAPDTEPLVQYLPGGPVNGLHPGAGGAAGVSGVGGNGGFGSTGGVGGVSGFGGTGGLGGSGGFGGTGGISGSGGTGGVSGSGGTGGFGGTGGISGSGGTGGFGGSSGFGGSGGVSGSGGTGGSSGSGGSGGTGGASGTGGTGGGGPTQLVIDYLTVSQGGRYSPNNIGAAWIEHAGGGWIKTMEAWAGIRARYLTKFNAASGGNRTDAISGATFLWHTTHHNTWNLKDVNGNPMPAGDYQVVIELTDKDQTGQSITIPFTLGSSTGPQTANGSQYYTNISLTLQ